MSGEPLLSFDQVTVRYPGSDLAAVVDISFSVASGERVALVGPSGAGKSTLLALAAGLVLPSAGDVSVLGVSSAQLGRRAHRSTRSRIGIVSQDFSLVGPLRVASNVAAGRLGTASWWQAARSLVRPGPIEQIARELERLGIGDKVWDRADQLSGGQQQRTAIARALFQRPDLLLADEPVSALDPARSESVMGVLAAHVADERRAMVASMHDAPLALAHCDRIVAMRHGRVHFDRPSGQVTGDMLAELYELDEQPAP